MARIRSIKPELQNSNSMGRVSREARLTFILLWPQCDDAGRIRANSRMLASVLFPYDEDAPGLIDGWLSELEKEQCIVLYEVDGAKYLAIVNWSHQKIDHPTASKLPPPPEKSAKKTKRKSREEQASSSEASDKPRPVSSTVSEGKGKEGSGADAPFETFWKACPKKEGKGDAEKAWAKAVKTVEPAVLIAAMLRYASKQAGKDQAYIKTPGPWLNAKRWLDEGLAPTAPPDETAVNAASEAWNGEAARLVQQIGPEAFKAWFGEAQFEPGPPCLIVVKKQFQRDMIERKYSVPLRRAFGEVELRVAA